MARFSSQLDLTHGVAGFAALGLARYGDVWRGGCQGACQVRYDQGGSFPIPIAIDDTYVEVLGQIQMESQDVTIGTRTISLILSLTWVIVAFDVLELRVDNERHERKQCNENDYRV
jgi:hypothetical protein